MIYTNRDAIEISSAPGDVLAEHRAKSKSRMPSPLAIMRPPSHRASSSSFATASLSAFSAQSDPRNHHHPYSHAGSSAGGTHSNSEDKVNTRNAGYNFLATLCIHDCWMPSCDIHRGWARDALLIANARARVEKRGETIESDYVLRVVSILYFTLGS